MRHPQETRCRTDRYCGGRQPSLLGEGAVPRRHFLFPKHPLTPAYVELGDGSISLDQR